MEEELQTELKTRKRILQIYTKDVSDFDSPADYDNYLEMREDIIFSLLSGEDVEKIETEIAQYKQENQESIHRHRRRKLEETNASFAGSLDKLAVEATVTEGEGTKGVRGPQPMPLESGHELTAEGSLQVKRRPKTSTEWHVMAHAAGWSKHHYSDFVRRQTVDQICRQRC